MHDVVIIGAGPAGMTAAIYACRKMLDLAIISPDIGGQTIWASDVENYLGYSLISGIDLAFKFEEHMRTFNITPVDDKIQILEKRGNTFRMKTEGGKEFESRSVVAASGRSARNLGVPGEEEYKGRGVAYCATCDAPMFAEEDVAVAGGGNAGLSAAVQLTKIANKVYLIEEMPELTGDPMLQDRIRKSDIAEVFTKTEITKISGEKLVKGISTRNLDTGKTMELPVAGVFVEIGSLPNTHFLPKEVNLTARGEIVIDCSNNTNIPGLFGAGGVTSVPHKQIIIAAGEGAKALLSAYDYIVRNFEDGAR